MKCELCKYYHESECRRYPPPFQVVSAETWCGEFKERIKEIKEKENVEPSKDKCSTVTAGKSESNTDIARTFRDKYPRKSKDSGSPADSSSGRKPVGSGKRKPGN
jgi:hypothetical protein